MTEEMAAVGRPQTPKLLQELAVLGALRSISFMGVGRQGWDIYEVKFANGIAIWRIYLDSDGKIAGLLFQTGP